jgi:hypothetical protein
MPTTRYAQKISLEQNIFEIKMIVLIFHHPVLIYFNMHETFFRFLLENPFGPRNLDIHVRNVTTFMAIFRNSKKLCSKFRIEG